MKNDEINMDWPLVGNAHITQFLAKSLSKKNIAGAYIFSGPDNLGKNTAARHFAKALLCEKSTKGSGRIPCDFCPSCRQFKSASSASEALTNDGMEQSVIHSDFHFIAKDKEKKNISIEQIRTLIKELSMSSFLNSYKIGIIKHAEKMTEEAANALLKTLEEPKQRVVIILVTSDIDALPATIVSRAQTLVFQEVKTDLIYDYLIREYKLPRGAAKNFARLSLGRPALAVKFMQDSGFREGYLKKAEDFLNFFSHDLNYRFKAIESAVGKEAKGQSASVPALRTLEIWEGLVRDIAFLKYGQNDIVQHEILGEKLDEVAKTLATQTLLKLADSIKQAKGYIHANVSPKMALESVAITLR